MARGQSGSGATLFGAREPASISGRHSQMTRRRKYNGACVYRLARRREQRTKATTTPLVKQRELLLRQKKRAMRDRC